MAFVNLSGKMMSAPVSMCGMSQTGGRLKADKSYWEEQWNQCPDELRCFPASRTVECMSLQHSKVLDVGCGDSKDDLKLNSHFIGGDISYRAAREAKRNNPDAQFMNLEATHLPFSQGAFKVVTSHEVIIHQGMNTYKALSEMSRVAEDGIVFTVRHQDMIEECRTLNRGKGKLHTVQFDFCRALMRQERSRGLFRKPEFGDLSSDICWLFFEQKGITNLLRRMGFEQIQVSRLGDDGRDGLKTLDKNSGEDTHLMEVYAFKEGVKMEFEQ
ncbi:MAG TPA: class I SAM-dependent methyltransferase [Candidatus Acidoferrales bacterium]|nr:class I SAM-dependent methyltransferase [Candidatus Acidoferrales bacterium]